MKRCGAEWVKWFLEEGRKPWEWVSAESKACSQLMIIRQYYYRLLLLSLSISLIMGCQMSDSLVSVRPCQQEILPHLRTLLPQRRTIWSGFRVTAFAQRHATTFRLVWPTRRDFKPASPKRSILKETYFQRTDPRSSELNCLRAFLQTKRAVYFCFSLYLWEEIGELTILLLECGYFVFDIITAETRAPSYR